MPHYKSPTHDPDTEPVTGVLLVNLGTPDAPTGKALRPYLTQFLGDPRVIEYPRWLWQPLLHGVILNVRPRRSAELYTSIWTEEGSPLLLGTQSLARKLQERLGAGVKVVVGMRYGRPSIHDALEELRRANAQHILVAPLFPQYSATTTATIYDVVFDEMKQWRYVPELRTINTYHTHPLYIQGIADSIRAHWQENGKADKLLLSFHGIPQSYADKGDPYPEYCHETARLVAAQLGLDEAEYQVCFQSRFGPEEWLQPYTDKTLEAWAKEGITSVDTLCPGFAIDCLETLEEMAEQNKHIYLNAGGQQYQYIPCLNDSPAQVDLFADLIRTNLTGLRDLSGLRNLMNTSQLLAKYDIPAPRYTSYPTVPYWSDDPTPEQWLAELQQTFESNPESTWSLYIHIPFCESLCTFCGCNTFITHNHSHEISYTEVIHKEWELYLAHLPQLGSAPVRQIHLGGGTPTFYSADSLRQLLRPILEAVQIDPAQFEGSIEVGPRVTNKEQLVALREMGFQRISMGVQDFNSEVQHLINRIQPYEMTRDLTLLSRDLGFESVNYDLIYGLPAQTEESFQKTADLTMSLRPDRIALYSFAFVPWVKKAHRLFTEEDLPKGAEKRTLYELARETFLKAGYVELGLDHFALPSDLLYEAYEHGRLHRNFMGYTDQRTDVMIGLGVSSISEAPTCFHQNEKGLNDYKGKVLDGQIPTFRGHLLTEEDRLQREQILQFMTQGVVVLHDDEQADDVRAYLSEMIDDGLVTVAGRRMALTEAGRPFLRNAAMALDMRLRRHKPETRIFSQAV